MQNIKEKIEEKIVYLVSEIVNSKESKIDFDSIDEEYIQEYRTIWEELSFKQKQTIKIKVENLNDFEFEQDEPFYDKSNKNIYYVNDTELDDFADILIKMFDAPKLLYGNFKYILTKENDKIKIVDNILFDKINSLWIKINNKIKVKIIDELIKVGFKEDITFKLKYTQDDFDCINNKDKTEDTIQILIEEILSEEQLQKDIIQFDCKTKNIEFIDKIINTYKNVLDDDLVNDEYDLLKKKICLSSDIFFTFINENEEDLIAKLNSLRDDNLSEEYKLGCMVPKEDDKELQKTKSNDLEPSSVNKSTGKQEKVESNRMAKKRGLRIESLLVEKLATNFKDKQTDIIKLANNIYKNMKNETSKNGKKRFNLKNETEYDKILKNGSLEEILHISKNLGDGVGFDILFPTIREDSELKLLKVEVKSSEAGKTIYLTENERKQILIYKEKNNKDIDKDFRVYLYIKGQDPKDITENVFTILENNNNFLNIKAETWILDINTKENTK